MYAKKNSGMKVVATLLAIALLIGGVVGGTIAYLVAQTNTVTNTFTVGNITIDLTETINGTKTSAKETAVTNSNFKIVPGATQTKDPVITVEKGSEKCYVYALVDNTMKIGDYVVVTTNMSTTDWEVVQTSGTKTLYRYKGANATNGVVDASSAAVDCTVFTQITYNAEKITETNISDLATKNIIIDAFAHQSDNTDQATADAAAKVHFGFST